MVSATRREARERAVELLYEAESKSVDVTDVVASLPLTPDAYAMELALGVTDHRIELDHLLGRYARRWQVSRMAVTDRAVLRLGAFELATQTDVPAGAALSEAVELGGRYGSTDDTSKFVNGILAAVATEVRGGDRPWRPVDTVVFDMDGVIRHWLPEYLAEAEERLGLDAGVIAAAAFARPTYGEVMIGAHTAEEWAAIIGTSVVRSAAAGVEIDADEVAEVWLGTTWRVDQQVVDLVAGLRAAGVTVALFSNATTKLEADLESMGLGQAFDVVANSARLGAAKPDVAAFEQVAGMVGSAPERTLFVDDRADNVAGAVEAGWHAIEMHSASRLVNALRRLAVPGAPDPS
ncbi:MAG: transcription antitermination factor NusB [Acidimicrobiales bacterium]